MKIKRGIAVLLALLMVIGAVPATAMAEEDWTPTETYCPSDRSGDNTHFFLDWEVFMDATCTWDGLMTRRCYFCGYEQQQVIPAYGHNYGEWNTLKNPTCTEEGKRIRYCVECGEEETQTIAAKGHSYGSWETIQLPTCTSEGTRRRTCSVCGNVQTESVAKLPHNVTDWKVTIPMTPFSYGHREGTCSVCGQVQGEDIIPAGILKNGDSGDGVKNLQEALNAAGFNCGYADGVFGGNTQTAVAGFEGTIGVSQDGIAWPGVQKELFNRTGHPGQSGKIQLSVNKVSPQKDTFTSGEEVAYELIFSNYTGKTIQNWDIFYCENVVESDKVNGWSMAESSHGANIAPDETFTTLFKYTITDQDVQAGGEALHWYLAGDLSSGGVAFSNIYDLGVSTEMAVQEPAEAPETEPAEAPETEPAGVPETEPAGAPETAPAEKTDSPHITLTPEDTTGLTAEPGQEIPVKITVLNDGNCDVIIDHMEIGGGDGSWNPLKADNYSMPAGVFTLFEKGGSFDVAYTIVVQDEDISYGTVHRIFWMYAKDTNGGEPQMYIASVSIPLKGAEEEPGTASVSLSMTEYNLSPDVLYESGYEEGLEGEVGWAYYYGYIKNTGSLPIAVDSLYVRLYPDKETGTKSRSFDPVIELQPEESCLFYNGQNLLADNIDPSTASEILAGEITPEFYVTACEPGTMSALCDSNSVPFTYKVYPDPGKTGTEEEEPLLSAAKVVTSTSKLTDGYTEGEKIDYAITVTNNSGTEVPEVFVYDPLKGSSEDMLVDIIMPLKPYSSETVYFSHVVTADDVEKGYVENTAVINWTWGESNHEIYTNTVTVDTFKEAVDPYVEKSVTTLPENGSYYVPGEKIGYEILVKNESGKNLTFCFMDPLLSPSDPRMDPLNPPFTVSEPLPDGTTVTCAYEYVVTDLDASAGHVSNIATVAFTDENNNELVMTTNEVTVPTGADPEITVTKEETSSPANGSYYTEGETITYKIEVQNTGALLLDEAIVLDTLQPGSGEIASIELFDPMEVFTYAFSHVVTAEDVDAGMVINEVIVKHTDGNGKEWQFYSNKVVSPTGKDAPKKEEKPLNCCTWTLTGLGKGQETTRLNYCDLHKNTEKQAKALISAASPEELQEAWKQAAVLWTEALNAEYDELLSKSAEDAVPIIVDEKALFFIQLGCYKEALENQYPEDPVKVMEITTGMLRKKCTELCYEMHTAPESRLDSYAAGGYTTLPDLDPLPEMPVRKVTEDENGITIEEVLNENYGKFQVMNMSMAGNGEGAEQLVKDWKIAGQLWQLEMKILLSERHEAADEEGRRLLDAQAASYSKWLKAREDFLSLMYTGRPEIAAEVLARTVQNRLIDLCVD